jgi:serine/threonine protein kinase
MALPAQLSSDDLVKFRTRFCERFLQYGECNFGGKCQYSHNMAWRRRSPQKYLYEPRMCDNIISYGNPPVAGSPYTCHSVLNCHNGKNCKFAHSREEVLYHPLVYKTLVCEDHHCSKYYCPFGHSHEELLPSHESPDYIKRCVMEVILEVDENDCSDYEVGQFEEADLDSHMHLRLRKASGHNILPAPAVATVPRISLPIPGSAEWNISDLSGWVAVIPTLRIETVIRAHSPVVASELCRALLMRDGMAGAAAVRKPNPGLVVSNHPGNQFCLAKVLQFSQTDNPDRVSQLVSELNTLAKGEHKNLLGIKKLYFGKIPAATDTMLCIAFDQCSTSLHQIVADGYLGVGSSAVKGFAKKLNPHTGTTTTTAILRINDLVSGLQRLHFTGISHLRICPTNVLIDNEAGFKIGDFLGKIGLGKSSPDSVLVWQPNEVIEATTQLSNFNCFDKQYKKADVFSLGCVVFYAMTGQHPFGSLKNPKSIIENIQSDYIANQHLLYNCPLVLDFCFRALAHDPTHRLDASDLSRHPLFWDFDFVRSFFFNLPWDNEGFLEFVDQYELVGWKKIVKESVDNEYADTIGGVTRYIIEQWKSVGADSASVWVRLLDRFPQILIRLWDATTRKADGIVFKRNHLHWMTLRNSAVTSVSHGFVREYYSALLNPSEFIPHDESETLSEACSQCVFTHNPPRPVPRPSPPVAPVVSSVLFQDMTTPGMKFVDPLIVKQMAAASAALTAVYDNADLVNGILKQGKHMHVGPHQQLLAAAAIYASLLDGGAGRTSW